ncbi:MAG: ASKHA domain-containing protein [Thermoleophilia bacterium]
MATVTFSPSGESIEVPVGTSLLDAAILCDLDLPAPCAGQGRCGRCRVRVTSGEVVRRSNAGLEMQEIAEGWTVGCLTYVAGPVEAYIPPRKRENVRPHGHAAAQPEALLVPCEWQQNPSVRSVTITLDPPTLEDNTSDLDRLRRELARQADITSLRAQLPLLRDLGHVLRSSNWNVRVTLEMQDWAYGSLLPPRLVDIRAADEVSGNYGLAVDIGTTSIVAYLIDFDTARIVDSESAYNRQISCGEDVISRIIFARRNNGLDQLQSLVLATINDLIARLVERNHISGRDIHEVAMAGNTTMTHLLLHIDPRYLREEPYIPTVAQPPRLLAADLRLDVNQLARVHCLPAVGSYVGGDITAGVISSGMYATEKLTLFIDIGTNGEMVLGNRDWLLSCACSAGPAFEGGGVKHGMRASEGAIEDVYIDDATFEPSFRTIDDAPPVGICGSGLIDLLGELFYTGLLDKSGHLNRDATTDRVRVNSATAEYVVVFAGDRDAAQDIVITDSDITSLLRAKAAIYAGYEVLCRSVGVDLADVEQILIGGAFGQYLNVEKAIRIGLLPDQPVEHFRFLGNTSAQGAYATLLCASTRQEVRDVAAKMTYLELSADNSFMDEYTSALFLPHTDLEAFPSVARALAERANDAMKS